jgi:hypothetical protein
MDDQFSTAAILEKPKEEIVKPNKKDINFQELPKGTEETLSNQIQKDLIDKFTKDEPVAIPVDSNTNTTHLSLILSPNLRELEMMIRGLEYIKRYNPVIGKDEIILRKIKDHPLNEYGINKIMELLKVWSSSELKLGRRTQKDAIESAQQIGKDARRLIYKNLKNFGMDNQIKQRSAKTYGLAIFEFTYSALSRSVEGRENDASRPTAFEIQGNVDTVTDPSKYISPQKKESLKN